MDENNPDVILVEWYTVENKYRADWFVRIGSDLFRDFDVSYVHHCENTRTAVLAFLAHLPLHDVTIRHNEWEEILLDFLRR